MTSRILLKAFRSRVMTLASRPRGKLVKCSSNDGGLFLTDKLLTRVIIGGNYEALRRYA